MKKEYLSLLGIRESKEVLGHHYSNLWLLALVLAATFVAIAFSNGSMGYLSEKMNDPFTNWVNISKGYGQDRFEELRSNLVEEDVQEHYGFSDVQGDNYMALNFIGCNGRDHYLECRFFERLNTDLVKAILDKDNVIGGCTTPMENIRTQSLGLVITADVLTKLGFSEDSIPAYIDYLSYSRGADTLGVSLLQDKYAAAPMPLLGVVKRLPMNMDIIGSNYFYEQYNNITHPFSLCNEDYARELMYYVDNTVADFEEQVRTFTPNGYGKMYVLEYTDNVDYLKSWKATAGRIMQVSLGDASIPTSELINLDQKIQKLYQGSSLVTRIYKYSVSDAPLSERRFLSVNFTSLDSIRAFEKYAKDNFNVQIEMSQVASKENFNDVTILAGILSWAMIVFSIICIIMFVVNMLQSYFQKVKRNLGTFKAFGIGTAELIRVYVAILLMIIVVAILMGLAFTWLLQLLLPAFGVCRYVNEARFNYLSLWNWNTLLSIFIVIVATLVTVWMVMKNLLKQTPGDLIYDR